MDGHHQPQTEIVVIVVRVVVVAIRRGGVILIVIEGTAPQHFPGSLTIYRRTLIILWFGASTHPTNAQLLLPFC